MSSTSIVDRCLSLLELLTEAPGGMPLSKISQRSGLPKSAAHRMLASLVEAGFVRQADNRDYQLTMKLTTLGFRFLANTELVDQCQVVLDRLALEVGELVRMAIVDGDNLVWMARAQGARSGLVVDPVMGRHVVTHATATGKVWLASLPQETALRIVLRDGFGTPEQHGPNVIQSIEALIDDLARTRELGYALALEEADPGIVAIAVGIRASADVDEPIAGTVSIAGPVFRLSEERLLSYLDLLKATAKELSGIGPVLRYWGSRARADPSGAPMIGGRLPFRPAP